MADNYLEKKMDEHRRGAAVSPVRRRLSLTGERPGSVSLKIEPLRVLVSDVADEYAAAVVRKLRDAGCRVAFVSSDDKAGRALAQSTGSRYYPSSLGDGAAADLAATWGGLDAVIFTGASAMPASVDQSALKRVITVAPDPALAAIAPHDGLTVNAVATSGRTPADTAHLCLLLCLTASTCLNRQVL